ncbi:MAG TPA: hypothetical protein VI356_13555, partial [Myxococcales bacterium]
MKRLTLTLAILAAACSSHDKPEITVFTAAPASVALGGTTQLVFNATAGATLTIDQGVGDVTGKTTATVTPTANTTYTLTASKGGQTATKTAAVSVTASPSAAFRVTGPTATTAGVPVDFTIAAVDTAGAVNPNYRGTVQFVSDDEQGSMSTNLTFAAADAGQKTVSATFRTAGTRLFVTQDTSVATAQGIAQVRVSAADAVRLDVSGVPLSAVAGDQLAMTVTARDAFGNVADGFTGTVTFTSSDPAASLPAAFTFTAGDKGSHSFSVLLSTAGNATVTASSGSLTPGSGNVNVKHGVTGLSVAFAGAEAWAGTPATATVTAQDKFGNRVTNYTGTVAFTSSDAAASVPANVTFAAADNGQVTVNVTFNTIGAQTFTATDTAAASVTGSGSQTVHGLVYTNPATGGKVRLVANATSNASVVQLDLVSNTSLFPLTAGTNDTVRNGAFAAGMNLPLDSTKVGPDATLLVTTPPTTVPASSAVLNLGAAPQAVGAAIANGVLYSGVSQKRIDATAGPGANNARGDVAVRPFPGAASFYYSLRL